MIGTIFNTCMILGGSILGSLFKKGMKEKYHEILMQALGLAVVALGLNTVVKHMPHSRYPVLFILSLAVSDVIGSFLDLDSRFDSLVSKHSNGQAVQGISTGILLFCIGTLSILGPVNAALNHDYTYLFTNGMLDGVTSTVLASRYGICILCLRARAFLLARFYLPFGQTLCHSHQHDAIDRTFDRRRHLNPCVRHQYFGTQKNQHYESVAFIADSSDRIAVSLKCFT